MQFAGNGGRQDRQQRNHAGHVAVVFTKPSWHRRRSRLQFLLNGGASFDQFTDHMRQQVIRTNSGQGGAVFSQRRPDGINDLNISYSNELFDKRESGVTGTSPICVRWPVVLNPETGEPVNL